MKPSPATLLRRLRPAALGAVAGALALIGPSGDAAEAETPKQIVQTGFERLKDGDAGKALERFDAALERDPSSVAARFGRANAYSALGRHQEAFDAYSKVVERAPGHIVAWNGRGIAAFNMRAFDKALESFLRATENRPVNGFFYESLAWTRLCRGEHEKTVEAARTASEMYQRSDRTNLYPQLIAYFAHKGLNQHQAARQALAYARDAARSNEWPYPVLEYLRGAIDADELISFVSDPTEETEAHAYIGLNARASGNPEKARRHLAWVAEQGDPRVFEYTLAKTIVAPGRLALDR